MTRWLKRLAMGWFVWRLAAPEPRPKFKEHQQHPLRVGGRTVYVGDYEFFVREAGRPDAPPVILIHGWGDHSLVVWWKVVETLAKRFRVVFLDNRNTGKSEKIRMPYEIADMADDLAGVMSALRIDKAPVVGYSMGGLAALEMAHRHPDRVEKLVLAGTSAGPARTSSERAYGAVAVVLGRALDRISRSTVSRIRVRYLMAAGAVDLRHGRWAFWEHLNRDPELYWWAGSAINRFDARPWISKLEQPSMVIINTKDQLMFPDRQYELASLLPDPTVVELVGARHEAPLTHSDEMASAISEFLKSN